MLEEVAEMAKQEKAEVERAMEAVKQEHAEAEKEWKVRRPCSPSPHNPPLSQLTRL